MSDTAYDYKIGPICPHCGKSYFMEDYTIATTAYYPPIYKDGVNTNPDRNAITTHYTCLACGKNFSF